MNDKVSIIVPVYNVERYLDRCLRSLVGQTYGHLEILLVNDGSQDGSGHICDAWAASDPRIRVIHQENQGISGARNTAMKIASGEFWMFVDSDDYLPSDAVACLVETILWDNSEIVIGGYHAVYEDGRKLLRGSWSPSKVMDGLTILADRDGYSCPVALWAKLYRRDVLKDIVYPPLKCGEDLWVFPLIMKSCRRVTVLDRSVYCYFRHDKSVMYNRSEAHKADEAAATLHMAGCLLEWGCLENACRWYDRGILQLMKLKIRGTAQRLLEENLTKEQRRRLHLGLCAKRKLAVISVFVPGLFQIYQCLAKGAHKNTKKV